jgi:hypothetical protein
MTVVFSPWTARGKVRSEECATRVALREEKIVKQAETIAKYSDGALMSSARKAAGQVEKHLDLLETSASRAARNIKVDLRHNAERIEAIIREVVKRNLP